jgi:hypothetical protein
MRITSLVLIALLYTVAVSAQNQPSLTDYQVLLVPVFFFGPGAHGSQWETSVSLASTSESGTASMAVPLLADPNDGCGPPTGEIEKDLRYFLCSGYASPSGLFLYIPKTLKAQELHVNARVRDLTRAASSAGTAVPVVPESEFSSGDVLLLDIPSDTRFRSNLRIYGGTMIFSAESRFINPGGPGVRVEIYDSRELNSRPLVSTDVALSAAEAIAGSPYLVRPGYFSIGDLVAAFPQLATVPSYTIRIRTGQPLTSPVVELTIWAFVTITNNDTQEVTTVSP